jgi:hypothetical protein
VQELTWKVQQQIEWRRSKVLEYSSQGFNQKEIASKLQVDESTISRDLAFLKDQARDRIKDYIQKTLPLEFQKCMTALNIVKKDAWMVAQQSNDAKVKLAALSLVKDCATTTMDVLTNAAVVDDAVSLAEQALASLPNGRGETRQQETVKAKAKEAAYIAELKRSRNDSGVREKGDIQRSQEKDPNISPGSGTTTTSNKAF